MIGLPWMGQRYLRRLPLECRHVQYFLIFAVLFLLFCFTVGNFFPDKLTYASCVIAVYDVRILVTDR